MNQSTVLLAVAASFLALWATRIAAQGVLTYQPPKPPAVHVVPDHSRHADRPALRKVVQRFKRRPHIFIRILPRYRPHPRADRIRPDAPKHGVRGPTCHSQACAIARLHRPPTTRLFPRSHFH